MVDYGAGAKGAIGGAGIGTAIAPGIGTAIGAGIGGLAGLFGGGGDSAGTGTFRDRAWIEDVIKSGYYPGGISQNVAPQMQAANASAAQLNLGNDPFRAAQLRQLGQLQGVASGQQQGAGELAAQRQIQNALAAQQANARMARGGNAALAYRNAANQSAALGSTGAGMGQQAAMQDQMNAQGLLGQVGTSGRAGDYNVANANAGYQQQTGLANAGFQQGASQYNAGLQQQNQALNAQNYLALLQSMQGMNATEATGQNAMAMANQQRSDALLGAGMNAAGSILAAQQYGRGTSSPTPTGTGGGELMNPYVASDERLKTDVTDERAKIDAMLDGLRPVGWRYKDSKHGDGRHSGVMAQDMLRSEAGRQVVSEDAEGLKLDVKKAVSATLAASARLNERLRKLEGEARR